MSALYDPGVPPSPTTRTAASLRSAPPSPARPCRPPTAAAAAAATAAVSAAHKRSSTSHAPPASSIQATQEQEQEQENDNKASISRASRRARHSQAFVERCDALERLLELELDRHARRALASHQRHEPWRFSSSPLAHDDLSAAQARAQTQSAPLASTSTSASASASASTQQQQQQQGTGTSSMSTSNTRTRRARSKSRAAAEVQDVEPGSVEPRRQQSASAERWIDGDLPVRLQSRRATSQQPHSSPRRARTGTPPTTTVQTGARREDQASAATSQDERAQVLTREQAARTLGPASVERPLSSDPHKGQSQVCDDDGAVAARDGRSMDEQRHTDDEEASSASDAEDLDVDEDYGPERQRQLEEQEREDEKRLDAIVRGVVTRFAEGKRLKESLPLSLVTKILYRSWLKDGTIPPTYHLTNPAPLEGSDADGPTLAPGAVAAAVASGQHDDVLDMTQLAGLMAQDSSAAGTLASRSASDLHLHAAAAPGEQEQQGHISPVSTFDRLKESRWRTERDVGSGSDVI